jgi:choline dehydrogenase-like flavoprotein
VQKAEVVEPPPVLTAAEEQDLLAIARVIMPAGEKLPAAGAETVARTHYGLRRTDHALSLGYRAALHSLSLLARLSHRRRISELTNAELERLLERLYHGGFARRMLVRSLLTPLKLAYYDDPAVFALLGEKYRSNSISEEEVSRRVVPEDQPRYVKERTQAASALSDGETIECDVVVIGTGAGGAVAAYELAAAGHAVVMLEEGLFFGRSDFSGSVLQMQKLLYREMGMTVAFGNNAIVVPVGCTVGGTTTVNSGTCYRMPERVFRHWHEDLGLSEYSSASIAPYYDRVEAVLGVAVAERSILGASSEAVARGAQRLGFRHAPLRRNAPECDAQGVCCFGCPTDAKRSTNVSYVPMALHAGANLLVGAHAERLIIEGGRAVGVEAVARFPKPGTQTTRPRFRVRARAVVVACGSLSTPVLLMSDPVARHVLKRSHALGEHLTIHPAAGVFAVMRELIHPAKGIPQGYAIEEFHDEGLLMEGAFTPTELTAVTMTLFGRPFVEAMEAFERLSCFGFMIEDSTTGSVRPGPGGRPLINYSLSEHDTARLKRGIDLLAQVYFAADAQRILTPVRGFEVLNSAAELTRFRRARLGPSDFELSAYHPLGTARMGVDPKKSIVDQELQAHDLPGLYICDGSVIPTSPAVNPQVTIMALASRAAQRLAGVLS